MKVITIFGTRPEAIKMAPIVTELKKHSNVESLICVSGQHRQMLDQVMDIFQLNADYDLNVMKENQTLNGLTSRIITEFDPVLEKEKPDLILVHGDTTTATACALTAFHRNIKIGHVEAGLRTGDLLHPFPEEMNRRVVDVVSNWMFAPTETSKKNLLQENLSGKIIVTGNTVIDALALTCKKIDDSVDLQKKLISKFSWIDSNKKCILVTGHRRENIGEGFKNICEALNELAINNPNAQIIYPVHLNPSVRKTVYEIIGNVDNIILIDPLDYVDFVWLMRKAHLILTDSGGIQEEAPFLGKPVLVLRDVTERPEAVSAGTVILVGTDKQKIVTQVNKLLSNDEYHNSFRFCKNPYGNGNASELIVSCLLEELKK